MNEKYEAYKKRRDLRTKYRKYCERRDARRKMAVDGGSDEEEKWITTKNGEHILINGENEVVGGAGGSMNGQKLNRAKSVPIEELQKREAEKNGNRREKNGNGKGYDPSKFAYNDPESVELYERIDRGDLLPLDELLEHPVVKNLDKIAEKYKDKYGDTSEIYTRDRMQKRDKILKRYLSKGSAEVVGTSPEGYPEYDFKGPVKKEFNAEIVMGYPAAGKSGKIANPDSLKMGAFVLDSDTIKSMIPEFEETNGGAAGAVHNESSDLNWKAFEQFVKKGGSRYGDNLVIPIVGGKESSVRDWLKCLDEAGYDVTIKLQEVDQKYSANKTVARAIASGRIIPSHVVRNQGNPTAVYKKIKYESGGKYHMDATKTNYKEEIEAARNNIVKYLKSINAYDGFIKRIETTENPFGFIYMAENDCEFLKKCNKEFDLTKQGGCMTAYMIATT